MVQKGYVPSTMKNMMTNMIMFFKHIEISFLGQSKLEQNELQNILYTLKGNNYAYLNYNSVLYLSVPILLI